MIERYRHPNMHAVWSDKRKLELWKEITDQYAFEYLDAGEKVTLAMIETPSVGMVQHREQYLGHDVVAFLDVYTSNKRMTTNIKAAIHVGLTSSDLQEYAHHMQLGASTDIILDVVDELASRLRGLGNDNRGQRLGRTHGQIAAPTTFENQTSVWFNSIQMIMADIYVVQQRLMVLKAPGPTGMSTSRREQAGEIAAILGLTVTPATQILARDRQLAWACVLLRLVAVLDDIALHVRLSARSEVREITERPRGIGSSSIPAKNNPITAEKISGLARYARGLFSTIAESVAFHNDRDISNSSVERTAVPEFAETVAYMANETHLLLGNMSINVRTMATNLREHWSEAVLSMMQTALQRAALITSTEASRFIAERFDEWDGEEVFVPYVGRHIEAAFNATTERDWYYGLQQLNNHWTL